MMKKVLLLIICFSFLGVASSLPVLASDDMVTGVKVKQRWQKQIKLSWDKTSEASEYLIRVANSKHKLVKKVKVDNNRATVKKLRRNKKYYFKIKAKVNGKYEDYSKKKRVKTRGVNSIELTGEDNSETVEWNTFGRSAQGYKLVWSKTSKPTYPTRSGDKYAYYSSSETETGTISAFDGEGYYYVRVCEYLGGKCGVYSNQIQVYLKTDEDSREVESITLVAGNENTKVNWSVEGTSDSGFKLVWSKTSGPTYPIRSGDKYAYYSCLNTTSGTISAFDESGTYYVRVCEYLGGACGVYSNQIEVEL